MKYRFPTVLVLGFQLAVASFAQQAAAPSSPPPSQQRPAPRAQQPQEEVVRITTNLVQVDAVITDKNGKLVTDLRPEEVRILEDGRSQKITYFSLITAGNAAGSPGVALPARSAKTIDTNAPPPPPPITLRPEEVRRTIALVIDDLSLSAESMFYVRRALNKFVDEEIQLGDLVAIIRTGSGIGALQQFTSDKRMLYAAIERVKWNPMGTGGMSAVIRIEASPLIGLMPAKDLAEADAAIAHLEQFRGNVFAVGTLGALSYVVGGLKELPGRKSILLVSDGLKLFSAEDRGSSNRVQQTLLNLADQANRASVVIYTMDARGLQTLALTAADNLSGRVTSAITRSNPRQIDQLLTDRRAAFSQSEEGLTNLAEETGGLAIRNNNDLSAGIRSVLDDQKSYYLIGYRPAESTFDARTGRRKFHSLSLKITRPGKFNVRMRKGFYGVADDQPTAKGTPQQQVIDAITSPFGAAGVQVRLTALFANDAKLGSFLTSLLHVRAADLTFNDEADGWHRANFDIVAVTFGDNGSVVDQEGRTHSIKVRGDAYQHMLEKGFVYIVTVPIRKPGAYQLRAALRDHGSERVGAASQFVEVPDIKSNRLLLSGVLLTGVDPTALKEPEPGAASAASRSGANEAQEQSAVEPEVMDPTNSAAVRQFHQGQFLQYGVTVYNAQLNKTTGRPRLQINVRLFRDRQPVFTGEPQEVNAADAPDLKRVSAAGAIQLGTELVPGEYVLQVIVTDLLADPKHRVATQWIDFEIVK